MEVKPVKNTSSLLSFSDHSELETRLFRNKYLHAAVMVTSLMSSLLGLGTTVTEPCWPFIRSLSDEDHGLSTLKLIGMSFCWPFSSKLRSNVMWACTVYPSFLFCPLLGITLTWVPALLSKRTFTKRVDDEESTVGERRRLFSVLIAVYKLLLAPNAHLPISRGPPNYSQQFYFFSLPEMLLSDYTTNNTKTRTSGPSLDVKTKENVFWNWNCFT